MDNTQLAAEIEALKAQLNQGGAFNAGGQVSDADIAAEAQKRIMERERGAADSQASAALRAQGEADAVKKLRQSLGIEAQTPETPVAAANVSPSPERSPSAEVQAPEINPNANNVAQLQATANGARAPSTSSIPVGAGSPSSGAGSGASFNKLLAKQRSAAEVGIQQAETDAAYAQKTADLADEFAKKGIEKDREYKDYIDSANKNIGEAQKDVDAYEFKDYWATKSIGQKISAALAIGIGQFGANIGGGPNHASNIINQAVDQHVIAEKMRYEKLKGKVGQAESQYGRVLAQVKDDKLADAVLANNAYGVLNKQLETLKAKNMPEQMRRNLDVVQATADYQRKTGLEAAQADYAQKFYKEQKDELEKRGKLEVPMLNAYGTNETLTNELNKELPQAMTTLAGIERLIKIADDPTARFNPKLKSEVEGLYLPIMGGIGTKILGRIGDNDRKFLAESIKTPGSVFSWTPSIIANLRTLQKNMSLSVANQAHAANIRDVTPEWILAKAIQEGRSLINPKGEGAQGLIEKNRERYGARQ